MQPFTYILCFDPAIDLLNSDLAKYMQTDRDPNLLKFQENAKPMIWHCKRLSREEIKAVRNAGSPQDSNEAAFKRGLQKVERLISSSGEVRDWFRQDGMAILNDKILEQYFSESMIQEVGSVIWQKSVLMASSTAPYVLPATSGLEVKGLLLLSAENRKKLALEQEKEKAKEMQVKQSLKNGETPMDVPAQESQKLNQE